MVEPSPLVIFILAAACLGSLTTLFWLFQKHIDGQQLLPFEPRRPVPWNFFAPLVVLTPLLGVSLPPSAADSLPPAAERASTAAAAMVTAASGAPWAGAASCAVDAAAVHYMRVGEQGSNPLLLIWAQVVVSLALTAACFALLILAFGATAHDLGLPKSWSQLRRDVKIGAMAFLAALVPIYGIQILLTSLFEPEHLHPLIEELATNHSPQMMTSAIVVAVLAAPIYEETAFRLTFQGWLERLAARPIHARRTESPMEAVGGADARPSATLENAVPSAPICEASRLSPPGWAPVLISGVLFGAAHLGHGVAPVSLVLLGIILGYIYQRTHRIVPSLVCHMLFNGLSIATLWLQLRSTSE